MLTEESAINKIALSIQNINVKYGSTNQAAVLNDFSMDIAEGKLACLLGASGCGKTTVLRAIAGFERLTHGAIYIRQKCVSDQHTHLPPEKRQVGMVFQQYALFPHLTATQNIAFGLRHLTAHQRKIKVAELFELIDLKKYEDHYPHELSGGQQQRISLARALAPHPAILLLDEPFSSLDQTTRKRLSIEVRDILRTAGQTTLLVTHSQDEAETMADEIGYIQAGKYQRNS